MNDFGKDLSLKDFINWAFLALLSMCVVYAVDAVKQLNATVQVNNNHISTLIERTSWHDKEIKRNEANLKDMSKRLSSLERK